MSYNKTLFFGGEMKNKIKDENKASYSYVPRCAIAVPLN